MTQNFRVYLNCIGTPRVSASGVHGDKEITNLFTEMIKELCSTFKQNMQKVIFNCSWFDGL